ncbi:MAG: DUF5320 domain-containing protein [Deltaproteobacteria bacterium]|nr:DUF5320 domain-containing protein [Deltaproteobacteria bacterium]
MPRGNRTGPIGAGPRTGRGAAFCSGYDIPGFVHVAPVRFFGRGWGERFFARGMGGWARGFWPSRFFSSSVQNPDMEIDQLKQEVSFLERTISDLKSRMDDLKSDK